MRASVGLSAFTQEDVVGTLGEKLKNELEHQNVRFQIAFFLDSFLLFHPFRASFIKSSKKRLKIILSTALRFSVLLFLI